MVSGADAAAAAAAGEGSSSSSKGVTMSNISTLRWAHEVFENSATVNS
jgi:hypothetical protein